MRHLLLCTGILTFLPSWLLAGPLWAQSPLVYDDPTFAWSDNRDPEAPRPSPNAFAGLQIGSTRVMIAYGSPGVRGRTIFGGLVPYGAVWRTGANEATTITFTGDVLVEGTAVAAGTYSLFTIPGERMWTIILNAENNQWGAYNYDEGKDVLRFTAPVREASFVERLRFGFEAVEPQAFAASVVLTWDTVAVAFRVEEP